MSILGLTWFGNFPKIVELQAASFAVM